MNQADIETFLMLVKTRNITKTAESLYVSQPTVSHRLKLLEEELGVPLLIRKKGYKKVELTPKGEEFVVIAQRWLSLMKETMLLKTAGEEMHLSVASTDTLNSCIFKDLYRSILHDTNLNLKLNISTHYSYEIYELLEKHTVDVGFVYHHLHYKNIISEPVLREKMYVVQEWESAIRKDQINVEELDPDNEVAFVWENNYQIWHEQMISKGKRNSLEVDIYSLFSEFLRDKGRWAIAPVTVVNRLQTEQKVFVSEIANKKKPPERITYIIRHKDMNEAKINTLKIFEERINQYFIDSGLDRYMERYHTTIM
ncbi:MAG: LysR family transcriptional regulator [Lachnospiraceae bacterium]|nr:LysR family transcriptional regulator [Lachnospiraceae bacterium]